MLFLLFLSFGVGCNAPAAQASQDDVFAEVQPVVQEAWSVAGHASLEGKDVRQ